MSIAVMIFMINFRENFHFAISRLKVHVIIIILGVIISIIVELN